MTTPISTEAKPCRTTMPRTFFAEAPRLNPNAELPVKVSPKVERLFEWVRDDIRKRLADLGLTSFAMLSGGKGVHVVMPLSTGHSWNAHKDFAKRFAEALSMAEPDRFTANLSKSSRKGRMFLDYLRNQRGATAILPYSARAREGAPVAAPVHWDELDDMASGAVFTVRDAETLLERAAARPLQGWGEADQMLPDL